MLLRLPISHSTSLRSRCAVSLSASVGVAALLVLSAAPAAVAHGEAEEHRAELVAAGEPALGDGRLLTSDTVRPVRNVPGTVGISGCFMPTAPLFVTSGLESVTTFDVSDPDSPEVVGKLDNAVFENEAMTCAERRINGTVRRFALVGVDLYQASSDDPDHVNLGDGQELLVVDVTNPGSPRIISRTDSTTSTHTVTCVADTQCRTAYSAGSDGKFSVFDLTNLAAPRQVRAVPSPAIGWGGHSWDVDAAGFGVHTGAGGAAMFDLSDPRSPRLVTTTPTRYASGATGNDGYNNFILHNSWRPSATAFRPGTAPALSNGNVLLVTEEDYEDVNCATAGSFQTWQVGRLDGTRGAIRPLDKVELADLGNYPLPAGAFCSAHWFDYHPKGFVATGYYGGGTQIIDVRKPRDLRSYGFALAGLSEVWDSYWVPRYDATGKRTGTTNIVYSVDLVRGLDVYRVDLGATGPAPASGPSRSSAGTGTAPAADRSAVQPAALAVAVLAVPLAALLRRRLRPVG